MATFEEQLNNLLERTHSIKSPTLTKIMIFIMLQHRINI